MPLRRTRVPVRGQGPRPGSTTDGWRSVPPAVGPRLAGAGSVATDTTEARDDRPPEHLPPQERRRWRVPKQPAPAPGPAHRDIGTPPIALTCCAAACQGHDRVPLPQMGSGGLILVALR